MPDDPPPQPDSAGLPHGAFALLGPQSGHAVIAHHDPNGVGWVVVRCEHSAGSTIVGLTPDHAESLARQLLAKASMARLARPAALGGLITPNGTG